MARWWELYNRTRFGSVGNVAGSLCNLSTIQVEYEIPGNGGDLWSFFLEFRIWVFFFCGSL